MDLEDIENAFPLSPTQHGMLYHCLEANRDDVYVAAIQLKIEARLDIERWKKAWQRTLQRHDALRAGFVWDGLEEPLQIIHKAFKPEWCVNDIRGLDKKSQRIKITKELTQARETGININSKLLMRFFLWQTDDNEWHLGWIIHHLLADGWSTPIILTDVCKSYAGKSDGSPAPSYANYVHWLGSRTNNEPYHWWEKYLSKAKTSLMKLPSSSSGIFSTPTTRSGIPLEELCLNPSLTQQIKQYCQREKITTASFFHGVWALITSLYADREHALFGTTITGRQPSMAHSSETVGLFVKTLPVFVELKDTQLLANLFRELQLDLAHIAQHDNISLSHLENLIEQNTQPTIESIVVMESYNHDVEFTCPDTDLRIFNLEYDSHSHYPLALLIYPGNDTKLKILYQSNLYCSSSIKLMLATLQHMIERIINYEYKSVLDCKLAPYSDNILPKLPSTQPTSLANAHKTTQRIDEWIADIARQHPERTALIDSHSTITYYELDRLSNQLARQIHNVTDQTCEGIGLYIERSNHLIVALLAILKTGRFYLPLDIEATHARTLEMLKIANVTTLVHMPNTSPPKVEGLNTIELDTDHSASTDFDLQSCGSTYAYKLFTSGSTGQPKAVQITHRNLIYSTQTRLDYYGQDSITFLLLSKMIFDSSVAGLYWTLCTGGTLVLPAVDDEKDMQVVGQAIQSYQVTHTLCLPSLYQLMLDYIDFKFLASMRCVVVAGESCPTALVSKHHQAQPQVALYNEYGPTETTVWCTVQRLEPRHINGITIGHAIPGTHITLQSPTGLPTPPGAKGELIVNSPGVASGYAREADDQSSFIGNSTNIGDLSSNMPSYRTGDECFLTENGEIVFVGRIDRQIKIRGHRIEPAEIENRIMEMSNIAQAVVVAKPISAPLPSDQALYSALNNIPSNDAAELINSIRTTGQPQ